MPFRLIIKSMTDLDHPDGVEYAYDQEIVKIGRKDTNDVKLRDSRRLVSSQHAEIRRKMGRYLLIDTGSKNGTRLNDEPLTPRQEYELREKDQLMIGEFQLEFLPTLTQAEKIHGEVPAPDSTVFLSQPSMDAMEVVEELNRAYWEKIEEEPQVRRDFLATVLRKTLDGKVKMEAGRILDLIEAHFAEPGYLEERVLDSGPSQKLSVSSEAIELYKSSYDGLIEIGKRYLEDENILKDSEEVRKFLQRIQVVLSILMNSLAVAVKGRKQFEEEFDVSATEIFSWKPNPLKLAQNEQEIGRYLFHSDGNEKSSDEVAAHLEEVFKDLALHQMGLMAGFKECLRGILTQLDPRSIKKESEAEPLKIGPVKIPGSFPLLASWLAWERYRKKHQELAEQEVKTFETILGPKFSKGYLAVQKKKSS